MAGRAYGKTVWSWPSLLRSNRSKMRASPTGWTASSNSNGEGGQRKVRLPGERGISRPTIAQGRPSDRHHLYAAVRFSACACISRSGPRVSVGTRPSLCPLGLEGGATKQSSGEISRENANARLPPHTRCHRPSGARLRTGAGDPVLRNSSDEPRSRGVLDSPHSRRMTVFVRRPNYRLMLRRKGSSQ
jgi:hypothetical protein